MGQEIGTTQFSNADFVDFNRRLAEETALLDHSIRAGRLSSKGPVTGFELEAWLVDRDMRPAAVNAEFLAAFDDPLCCLELAKFNVEFNNLPQVLAGDVLSRLHRDLECIWTRACRTAERLGVHLIAIGILPTVEEAVLNLANLSDMNRYRALNEQILAARRQRPVQLDIRGREHLTRLHSDVMLESAATSFQIHLQVPFNRVRAFFNASILASAPLVAVASNSPFLFGKDLWAETRIPLFEQAIDVDDRRNAGTRRPVRRVTFGTGYARTSITEAFAENLRDYPVLLPMVSDTPPERFDHLRLHNGTIWRWNRPLVGFDEDGRPHVRVEHRVIPAGPTIADMIANAAFFYGLVETMVAEEWERDIPFATARENFYQAARDGLAAQIIVAGGKTMRMADWVREELLPKAETGLGHLGLAATDVRRYLGIVEQRVDRRQTGSEWQRGFMAKHPNEFSTMTREYLNLQKGGTPVHQWPL